MGTQGEAQQGSDHVYHVQAEWDAEAATWVATSDDVPGLVTGADTLEALVEKLRVLVPEMLELNGVVPAEQVAGAVAGPERKGRMGGAVDARMDRPYAFPVKGGAESRGSATERKRPSPARRLIGR